MSKADWGFFVFITFMIILTVIYGVACGYDTGKKNVISELCGKTNGKYEFCIEKKTWDIKGA